MGQGARCRVWYSREGAASLVRASERWPEIPDRVLDCISSEVIALTQELYPNTMHPGVCDSFREHYRQVLAALLKQTKCLCPSKINVAPSQSLLVAESAVGYVLATYLPYEVPSEELPPMPDEEALLEALTQLSTNVFGPPYGVSEELAEIVRIAYEEESMKEALRQEGISVPEDSTQLQLNAFFAFGGPSPALIEEIVETGKVPYEAKYLLDVKEVRDVYTEMETHFNQGFYIEEFADSLVEASLGDNLSEGLQGRWPEIFSLLLPFLWPPAVSTAATLAVPLGLSEWTWANKDFARRLAGRDRKRRQRELPTTRLDAVVELVEGMVSPHEATADPRGSVEEQIEKQEEGAPTKPDLDKLFVGLTRRQRELVDLLNQGCSQQEASRIMKVTPGRISQMMKEIRHKCKKQPT